MKRIWKYLPLLLLTILIIFCSNLIIIESTKNYLYEDIEKIPFRKTALVLGSSKDGRYGGINPYFKYRMEATAELYFAGKIAYVIVSGDNSRVGYDEPSQMADYLVELGIPRDKITLDYAGFRTLDSVIRAKKVFNCKELIIVSQKFHNQRAVYAAKQYGIAAVGYNARDVQSKWNITHLREIASKFLMILDLHVFNTKPKFL